MFDLANLWHVALLFAAGIACGFLNVTAGGGSLITVPVLLFLGLPGPVANGTNRIAILAQNISAMIAFCRSGHAEFRLSLTLALATLPGSILGALAGTELEGVWFNRVVAAVMSVSLLAMATERRTPRSAPAAAVAPVEGLSRRRWWLGHAGMFLVGVWGGFIQIAVGLLMMPILHRVMGLSLVQTNMHKVFIILVYTCVALAIFAARVEIAWLVGLGLAAGNVVGGWLGARATIVHGERAIRAIFYCVAIAFVIKLLLE
ncbi:MAG: sulfite exporter TauE/SafE family protein [Gammaproteobacteria bacterium]|nr:sulfite exporter TauE/SafE family protein [Gammaproteobacteria bacterium]